MEKVMSVIVTVMFLMCLPVAARAAMLRHRARKNCTEKWHWMPVSPCYNDDCEHKQYCNDYVRVCSEKDINELMQLIDELSE